MLFLIAVNYKYSLGMDRSTNKGMEGEWKNQGSGSEGEFSESTVTHFGVRQS